MDAGSRTQTNKPLDQSSSGFLLTKIQHRKIGRGSLVEALGAQIQAERAVGSRLPVERPAPDQAASLSRTGADRASPRATAASRYGRMAPARKEMTGTTTELPN